MMPPPEKEIYANVLNKLSKELHETSKSKGFWPDDEENFKEDLKELFKDAVHNKVFTELYLECFFNDVMYLTKKHKAWDKEKSVSQKLLLVVSEISEALEGMREGNKMDKHLPTIPNLNVEIADAVIRLLDLSHSLGIDLGKALTEKMAFNAKREHLHGKAF